MEKVLLLALIIGIVCIAQHQINAGTVEPCAKADRAQPGGGCRGCWVILSGTRWEGEMPEAYTLQARCDNTLGDGLCPTEWSSAIPSPACYGETTSCGGTTKFYISSNTEASGDEECGVHFTAANYGQAWTYITNNGGGYQFEDPNDPNDFPVDHVAWMPNFQGAKLSCTNSYWDVKDVTTNANCTAP